MTGDVNYVMPGSVEDLGDLKKKAVSWDSSLEEGSRFLVSPRRDQLGSTKCAVRLLKKLCLSLLRSKNLKLKKVNKYFVPEPISSVFGFRYANEHLWTFYEHLYISWQCYKATFSKNPMETIFNSGRSVQLDSSYLPDLTPSDFYLLPSQQNEPKDKNISKENQMKMFVQNLLSSKPAKFYLRGINKLIKDKRRLKIMTNIDWKLFVVQLFIDMLCFTWTEIIYHATLHTHTHIYIYIYIYIKRADKHNPNRVIYYDVKSMLNVSVSVTIIRTLISE